MDPGATGLVEAAIRLLDGKTVAALAVGLLVSAVAGIVLARRTKLSPVVAGLTVFSVVAIAVATLQMGRAGGGVLDRDPFGHVSIGALAGCLTAVDVGSVLSSNEERLNLLLYVPFGVFATLAFGPWRAMAASVALILLMEALQSVLDVGVCSLLDVGANVAGVSIAIVATAAAERAVRYLATRHESREPR